VKARTPGAHARKSLAYWCANGSGESRVAFNIGVVEGELAWNAGNYLHPYEGQTEFKGLHAC